MRDADNLPSYGPWTVYGTSYQVLSESRYGKTGQLRTVNPDRLERVETGYRTEKIDGPAPIDMSASLPFSILALLPVSLFPIGFIGNFT